MEVVEGCYSAFALAENKRTVQEPRLSHEVSSPSSNYMTLLRCATGAETTPSERLLAGRPAGAGERLECCERIAGYHEEQYSGRKPNPFQKSVSIHQTQPPASGEF